MGWEEFVAKKKGGESMELIDVRPANMFKIVHLECSTNIPLECLSVSNVPQSDLYLMCRRGISSRQAALRLSSHPFRVFSLTGGIEEYSRVYKHAMPFL